VESSEDQNSVAKAKGRKKRKNQKKKE